MWNHEFKSNSQHLCLTSCATLCSEFTLKSRVLLIDQTLVSHCFIYKKWWPVQKSAPGVVCVCLLCVFHANVLFVWVPACLCVSDHHLENAMMIIVLSVALKILQKWNSNRGIACYMYSLKHGKQTFFTRPSCERGRKRSSLTSCDGWK